MATGTEQQRPPGEPVPDDELDPELIALPRRRPRVGPLLSLSVVVLCGLLTIKLWPDFVFAQQDTPRSYTSIDEVLENATANDRVRVRAVPDLTIGAVVRKSAGSYGHRIQPALGSNGRLWLMTHSYHWHAKPAYDQEFEGRLARAGDLPFYEDLKNRWSREPGSRVVSVATLAQALRESASEVQVAGGDRVALKPTTSIELAIRIPDLVSVTTYYTEELPDQDTWTLALKSAGLEVIGDRAQGQGESGETFIYRVRHPQGADAVSRILGEKRIYAARAEPIIREHRANASELRVQGTDILLASDDSVPLATVEFARVEAPYELGADDRIIIATDSPEDYWYVTAALGALAIVGLLFLALLGSSLWTIFAPSRDKS